MLIPLSVQQQFFRGTRHARTARPRVVPRFRRRRLRKVASATCLGSIGREILLSYDAVPSAEWCCHWQAQFIIENTGKITVLPWVRFNFPLVLDTATARVCASLAKGFAGKKCRGLLLHGHVPLKGKWGSLKKIYLAPRGSRCCLRATSKRSTKRDSLPARLQGPTKQLRIGHKAQQA